MDLSATCCTVVECRNTMVAPGPARPAHTVPALATTRIATTAPYAYAVRGRRSHAIEAASNAMTYIDAAIRTDAAGRGVLTAAVEGARGAFDSRSSTSSA